MNWIANSGTITSNQNGLADYAAPSFVATDTIGLEIGTGPSKGSGVSYSKNIIAPTGATAAQSTNTPTIVHTINKCSVGFYLYPYLQPTDVSFKEIKFREGKVKGTGTGYYLNINNKVHPETPFFDVLNGNVITGNKVNFEDFPYTNEGAPINNTCPNGDFIWPIPWEYAIGNNTPVLFFTAVHHQFTTFPDMTSIEKAGVGPFMKRLSDVSSFNSLTIEGSRK